MFRTTRNTGHDDDQYYEMPIRAGNIRHIPDSTYKDHKIELPHVETVKEAIGNRPVDVNTIVRVHIMAKRFILTAVMCVLATASYMCGMVSLVTHSKVLLTCASALIGICLAMVMANLVIIVWKRWHA
jgi:hypothetical protein